MAFKITKMKTHQNARDISHINLQNCTIASLTAVVNVELVNHIVLTDTVVVLEFQFTLLSVSKLIRDNNCIAVFYPELCLIHGCATKTLKGIGKERGGRLYHFLEVPVAELDSKVIDIGNKPLDKVVNRSVDSSKPIVMAQA